MADAAAGRGGRARDGIAFRDHTILIALGIDSDGRKHVLGLHEGTTENRRVAQALLRDLLERGLNPERARVFVIDGSKALRSAIHKVFDRLGVALGLVLRDLVLASGFEGRLDGTQRRDEQLHGRALPRPRSTIQGRLPAALGTLALPDRRLGT